MLEALDKNLTAPIRVYHTDWCLGLSPLSLMARNNKAVLCCESAVLYVAKAV